MTLWRYEAIGGADARRVGELSGDTEAEVRAALRRIGLVAIDVRPVGSGGGLLSVLLGARAGRRASEPAPTVARSRSSTASAADRLKETIDRWLRGRRRPVRAQLYDSMSTLLSSGIPLLEAIDALAGPASRRRARRLRTVLLQVREGLRGGRSLAEAMRPHSSWFDPVEVAIVEAGQHGGVLPEALARLSEHHEEGTKLGQRLAAALAYPSIVALAGIGVAVFLSVHTLPELTGMLSGANVPVPRLTIVVMAVGQWLFRWGWAVLLGAAAAPVAIALASSRPDRGGAAPGLLARRPWVARALAVGQSSLRLCELVRAGVPVVDALRVLAPTAPKGLGNRLRSAADRVEQGDELATALRDDRWFDEEYCRLVEVAEASGELEQMLERVGRRYEREARRIIDRLTTLLEPAVIAALACLVGIVVMAAVLPLVRLKEIV